MLDWLRRWLGESGEMADLRAENARLVRHCRDLSWAVRNRNRKIDGMNRVFRMLVEPMPSGECRKVRLRDRQEADVFARKVEAASGAGELEPYRCPLCPRQPTNPNARFWHVRHVDPELRGFHWRQKPAVTSIAHVASPADVARIKQQSRRTA